MTSQILGPIFKEMFKIARAEFDNYDIAKVGDENFDLIQKNKEYIPKVLNMVEKCLNPTNDGIEVQDEILRFIETDLKNYR